jgi:hypothetical protein
MEGPAEKEGGRYTSREISTMFKHSSNFMAEVDNRTEERGQRPEAGSTITIQFTYLKGRFTL